jgi:KipI family sensor histidine kinase inhibitor
VGEVRPFGDQALLLGVEDAEAGRQVVRRLQAQFEDGGAGGAFEVVGGVASVLVIGRAGAAMELAAPVVAAAMPEAGWAGPAGAAAPGATVTVPCTFDGPDLEAVCRFSGCPADEVVALLTGQPLTVGVLGFSPGFAFLSGLPGPLRDIPRRDRPRAAVPPGSVALANGLAAVYPTASPGGWHLIGRTGEAMFSLSPPYARLAPGDLVQFTVAGPDDLRAPEALMPPPWEPPAGAGHLFEVVQPGLHTLRQDAGRRGVVAIGVPSAGPADPVSFALANRLVGNRAGAGALEVTAQGPTLRTRATGYVAVVGGAPDVRVDGHGLSAGRVFPVQPGQVLRVGAVDSGGRTYVAVAGGVLGPELFGSCATDALSGLGAGPLRAGDALWTGPVTPPLGDHLDQPPDRVEGGSVVLRVLPGPHAEWFGPDALARLAAATFTVQGESNRVGLRLTADGGPLGLRGAPGELDSQGMVIGAVQVPPGGEPVVLLPDHATLGGYPVVAVVATVDHGRLGQCAPGDRVRLRPIELEEARAASLEQRRALDRAVVGHYPLAAG